MKSERLVMDSENQSEDGHLDPSIHAWAQYTSDNNATRSSSATAYVEPSKDNLHVLLNTYVTRVLPAEGTADFRGVEFAADAQSERKQLRANKEVIIAGGVIGTPQILLNSGIGPREELDAVGVRTIVNNPSVGKNFTDQVYTNMMFNTTIQDTDFDLETALAEWNANRTGPLIMPSNLKNQIVWVRFTDNEIPFVDPTPGENSPHVEFYFSQISSHPGFTNGEVPPEAIPTVANLTTIQLALINLHPTSRGTITLNNSDPFAYPNVDPGLLSGDTDFAVLREGIKSVQRLFSAPVFAESVFGSVYPPGSLTTDEELDAFVRAEAAPYLHGGSSASMSPRGASWGVVDPDFRVKQTTGLRIVDASVLFILQPSLPSGHTQAPVYGFVERASILIAEEWR
ncbi:hypothetical protein D9756_008774 [Leucocoprinus leucothites]|uniref:pyranose dehydrogenase (acceptor) n=1 Tax=Leucocoprinus leucothites TaxID=201217 RepID=A0A8H5FUZ5_9AGAR|nr:hypothetical protein D9756_008774 [Leucoagaricus leucothites]